jgi:hypothetical protein
MLEKYIRTVKSQVAWYEGKLRRADPKHPRFRQDQVDMYGRIAADLRDLLKYLGEQAGAPEIVIEPPVVVPHKVAKENLKNTTAPLRESPRPPAGEAVSSPDDLSDLPPELLAQLSAGAKSDTDPLIQIIDDRGGTATIDEILIDLYRKHKEIGKRAVISNKLYRLSRRGLCAAFPGRKGFYTTDKAQIAEAASKTAADEAAMTENDKGSGASTPEPLSIEPGAAGSQEGPSKPTPVGSNPTVSTKNRRDLFAGTSISTVASLTKKGETFM